MKILIVTCSEIETGPILKAFTKVKSVQEDLFQLRGHTGQILLLQSKPGMVALAYRLGIYLQNDRPDLIINAGICGSFDEKIPPGDVLLVTEDKFADLGADSGKGFIDIFEMGLYAKDEFPFQEGVLYADQGTYENLFSAFKKVRGITVNKVSGSQKNIDFLKNKYSPQIETMEGAAFHYVCRNEKLNFAQIRAVSNLVEERNKKKWNIPLAIDNLAISLKKLIDQFNE